MYLLRTVLMDEEVLQERDYELHLWDSLISSRDIKPSLYQIWLYYGEDEKVLVWQREYE